jgi:opacity protein-like surface antigen
MHVRSLLAVALAALLAAPASARAETKKPSQGKSSAPAKTAPATSSPAASAYSIGGWIGYEMGDQDGLQLRGDFLVPYQKLSPQSALSFVGSVGYSRLTDSGAGVDVTVNLLKLVPAARLTFPINAQLDLFADAGLGLYIAWASTDFPNGVTSDSSDVGFMLRIGGGGLYKLSPRTQIGAALVIDPMFNAVEDVTFSILAGVTYRL